MADVSLDYNYATNNAAPPGNEQIRLNQTTSAATTAVYADDQDTNGITVRDQLLAAIPGSQLTVTSVNNPANYASYTVNTVTGQTGYVQFNVTYLVGNGTIQTGPCTLELTVAAAGVIPQGPAPTLTNIREALAASLMGLQGIQVSAYMLANPTPPTIHIYPASIEYDLTFQRGLDGWTFTVQAFVGLSSDIGAQKLLDVFLMPAGQQSVKAALEADKTLGGLVDNLRVTSMSGYQSYMLEGRGSVFGAVWQVVVQADGSP